MPPYTRAPLCRACASTSECVFVLFSMLSDVRLTDSIHSDGRARCMTIYPASLGGVRMCLDSVCDGVCVCVCVPRGWKVFDPSYLQHPGVFVFTATAQPSS